MLTVPAASSGRAVDLVCCAYFRSERIARQGPSRCQSSFTGAFSRNHALEVVDNANEPVIIPVGGKVAKKSFVASVDVGMNIGVHGAFLCRWCGR
jgi:hypothetical protein